MERRWSCNHGVSGISDYSVFNLMTNALEEEVEKEENEGKRVNLLFSKIKLLSGI